MQQVTLEEAAQKLPELFDAAMRGEEVLVTANGEINATIQLVPRAAEARRAADERRPQFGSANRRQPGSAKGKIWMSDDFDAPLKI